MRLAPWLILPLLIVSSCHWKGDGNDEFIRDPFQRKTEAMQTGTGRPRDFGVPEQQVPRRDGRADLQMSGGHGLVAEAKGRNVFESEPSTGAREKAPADQTHKPAQPAGRRPSRD